MTSTTIPAVHLERASARPSWQFLNFRPLPHGHGSFLLAFMAVGIEVIVDLYLSGLFDKSQLNIPYP